MLNETTYDEGWAHAAWWVQENNPTDAELFRAAYIYAEPFDTDAGRGYNECLHHVIMSGIKAMINSPVVAEGDEYLTAKRFDSQLHVERMAMLESERKRNLAANRLADFYGVGPRGRRTREAHAEWERHAADMKNRLDVMALLSEGYRALRGYEWTAA